MRITVSGDISRAILTIFGSNTAGRFEMRIKRTLDIMVTGMSFERALKNSTFLAILALGVALTAIWWSLLVQLS